MYYLGDDYEGIYYTKREAECLIYLIQGNTLVATAKLMDLSPRTVEFYVKNMRLKIGATTKTQLLNKIEETDFVKNYHYNALEKAAAKKLEEEGSRA